MARNILPEEEVQKMLKTLSEHYGERVAPVSAYCKAFETWAEVQVKKFRESKKELEANGENTTFAFGSAIVPHFRVLERTIRKSDLLYRLVYLGEELREELCPLHQGKWSGLHPDPCPHACDYTGWLPKKKQGEPK